MAKGDIVEIKYKEPQDSGHLLELVPLSVIKKPQHDHNPHDNHRISFYLIYLVHAGKSTHSIDFENYPLNKMSVIFLKPGQIHHFGDLNQVEGDILVASEKIFEILNNENPLISDLLDSVFTATGPLILNDREYQQTKSLLETVAFVTKKTQLNLSAAPMSYLFSFILSEFRTMKTIAARNETLSHGDPLISRFKKSLEQNLLASKAVKDFAEDLNVSTRTLDRRCLQILKKTAREIIDERLLLEAKRILSYSTDPLKITADRLGFSDVSTFSKFFQRHEGVAPGQFRKQK